MKLKEIRINSPLHWAPGRIALTRLTSGEATEKANESQQGWTLDAGPSGIVATSRDGSRKFLVPYSMLTAVPEVLDEEAELERATRPALPAKGGKAA